MIRLGSVKPGEFIRKLPVHAREMKRGLLLSKIHLHRVSLY